MRLIGVVVVGLLGVLLGLGLSAPWLVYLCKPVASLAFVLLGLRGLGAGGVYERRVLLGLVLGAGGDVALMFHGRPAFLVGLVLFLLGHLAYCAACRSRAPLPSWLTPALLPLGLVSGVILCWIYPAVPLPLRGPVVAYVLVISAMVAGALAVFRRGGAGGGLVLAGALLFYASDIAVARNRFFPPSFLHTLWGLPAYYAAQVLFALSLSRARR